MAQEFSMPQPTAEHALVLEGVGTWDVQSKQFCEPGKPPMESKATDTVTALGGFWTTSRYEADFMGMPFTGSATFGFDTTRKKYVSTWIDSMMPCLWIFEGDHDPATRTFTLLGKGPDMTCQGLCDWKITMKHESKDRMVMAMYVCTPEGDVMTMENRYSRRR